MSSMTTGWCTTRPRRYLRGREREGVESELALTRDGGAAGRGAEQDNQILGTFDLPGTFEVATVPAASYKLENVFEIMSKAGHYMVQAESAADRDEWIRVLRELSRQKGCVSLASSALRPRWSSVKRGWCSERTHSGKAPPSAPAPAAEAPVAVVADAPVDEDGQAFAMPTPTDFRAAMEASPAYTHPAD